MPKLKQFGVEIEGYSFYKHSYIRRHITQKANVKFGSTWKRWVIAEDSSLAYDSGGFELKTPVLEYNTNSLKTLSFVCSCLKDLNCYAGWECGLHVHIDASDLTDEDAEKIFKRYKRFETYFDRFTLRHRKKNDNCYSLRGTDIDNARSEKDLKLTLYNHKRMVFGRTKEKKPGGSLEFRQHHGTVDEVEIISWIKLIQHFVHASLELPEEGIWTGIPQDVRRYYENRMRLTRNSMTNS